MCKICEEVMKNGEYVVDGSWTRLKIEKYKGNFYISALGLGVANMKIECCPKCGKKLGSKDDEYGMDFAIEMIKDANEEAQEYKDANQFCRGVAFAYRCVMNILKDFGGIE